MIQKDRPTAVYRFFDADGHLLYVGITGNPEIRFQGHARSSHWWSDQVAVTVGWKANRAEAMEEESTAILAENPLHNVAGATTPHVRPALPRAPVHRRPEWVAEIAGEVRAEIARRWSKKTRGELAAALGISTTAWDDRIYGVVEWRVTELIEMADLLGVTVDQFLPKRRTTKPPDPMGEGRTSGLVDAAPPLRTTEASGVPALAPGADAFSLPAPPALPRFAVGTALYAVRRRS